MKQKNNFISLCLSFALRHIDSLFSKKAYVPGQICDKGNKPEFRDCLKQNIPLGSSYEELKSFLSKHGFSIDRSELDKNNSFHFFWSANSLSNYTITIIGVCDSELKVIEMRVI